MARSKPEERGKKLTCKHTDGKGPLLFFIISGKEFTDERWDPEFYNPKYRPLFRDLKKRKARPLGDFIEKKGITYGQVGERKLSAQGTVRYLQVINIQETGIDFSIKPDRIREGSHNDPVRSRVKIGDVLLTNTSFGGMSRLLGRCVAVVTDYGKMNISQDIDRVCLHRIDPCYVCVFLRGKYGQGQMARFQHGVKSFKISFDNVRSILIPVPPKRVQAAVRKQYLAMNRWHEKAMARKEEIAGRNGRARGKKLKKSAEHNVAYMKRLEEARRRLLHLIGEVERYVRGEADTISPYRG